MSSKIFLTTYMMLFGAVALQAQQDFLILHQGDTIHGKYITSNSRFIHFHTETGKIKIPIKNVKAFYWKDKKYAVYEDPCEGGLSTYRVLIEGKATFLYSGGYEDYCPELIIINNEIYPIERNRSFSQELWNTISNCSAFKEKYEDYYNENLEKKIVWEWAYRKSRNMCLEMIMYYNENCGRVTN